MLVSRAESSIGNSQLLLVWYNVAIIHNELRSDATLLAIGASSNSIASSNVRCIVAAGWRDDALLHLPVSPILWLQAAMTPPPTPASHCDENSNQGVGGNSNSGHGEPMEHDSYGGALHPVGSDDFMQ